MGVKGTVRDGAILFGALAVGAGGAVAAEDLLTGKDIENRSLGKKELTKKAVKALTGQVGPQGLEGPKGDKGEPGDPGDPAPGGSILVSDFFFLGPAASGFVTPGGGSSNSGTQFNATEATMIVPPGATGGYTIRGLAVRSTETKIGTPTGGLVTTLNVNGAASELSCTTSVAAPAGECTDTGAVTVAPGTKLSLAVTNNAAVALGAAISLSLEPAA